MEDVKHAKNLYRVSEQVVSFNHHLAPLIACWATGKPRENITTASIEKEHNVDDVDNDADNDDTAEKKVEDMPDVQIILGPIQDTVSIWCQESYAFHQKKCRYNQLTLQNQPNTTALCIRCFW